MSSFLVVEVVEVFQGVEVICGLPFDHSDDPSRT